MPTFLVFFIVFSLLVLIHELGHFVMAKKAGVKVEEFGIGYPPRLWGKKIKETIYSINAIPFGGFVRLYGQDEKVVKDKRRAFYAQSKKKRSLIIMGGVVMNFFLGVICFALVYSKLGIPTQLDYIKVLDVTHDSPAYQAGIKPGDKIIQTEIEGRIEIAENSEAFVDLIIAHRGEELVLVMVDGRRLKVTARTEEDTPGGQGALGVGITNTEMKFFAWWQMPFRGIIAGLEEAILWGKEIIYSLGIMIKNLFRGVIPKDVAGPVGIYQITSEVKKGGFLAVAQFTGILSVNLAVINVLPFPGLDGAWIVFILLEKVLGKKRRRIEQLLSQAGLALLVLLMVLITINDVRRLVAN
ncbi:M50 family metallopeptidase [Patescibacteria group bacterium]|nr:M50 family metallopeptidase [Patescibacteria group bacterium]MBU1931609.1 M50 family metallopeptidase [Patescibacteria group bacterium]